MTCFFVGKIPYAWTELHRASYRGCLEKVQALVNGGADINFETDEGFTPLMLAAKGNYPDVVEYLITEGANINWPDKSKWTVLHYAAFNGWLSIARYLVKKGLDVNAKIADGESPLILAAINSNLDIIKFLVNSGADVNSCDECKWTVLHFASYGGWTAIATFLIEKGIDVNAKSGGGRTSLMLAAKKRHFDIVKVLCSAGANVNVCDANNWTALHFSSHKGREDISQYLLEKGSDIDAKTITGETPIMLAAAGHYHPETFKFLISAGADVHCCYDNNYTLLHLAVHIKRLDMVQSLVEKGIDVNAKTSEGQTPLLCTLDFEILRYLIDAGADCNAAADDGDTCLTVAVRWFKDVERVKFFLKNGAILKASDYNLMLKNPLLIEGILQDTKLCSEIIIDRFNSKELPTLYEFVGASLPPIDKMKIRSGSSVAQNVLQYVEHEVQSKKHCNVLKARPIALSMLAVKSIVDYCCVVKESRVAAKPVNKTARQNSSKRSRSVRSTTKKRTRRKY